MNKSSISMTVFRVTYPGNIENRTVFLKSLPNGHLSGNTTFGTTAMLSDSYSASILSISQIIDVLDQAQKELGEKGTIDLVEVCVDTTITEINTKTEDFISVRRQKALDKLTLSDIQALGLEKLATYNKLRYHKVDEDE